MKGLFTGLAVIFGLLGAVSVIGAVFTGDVFLILSAFISLISGGAWYLVGELWETVDYLGQEIYKLKNAR